jgi:DNA-directed RNA polymerase subunit RPC12/RpoP
MTMTNVKCDDCQNEFEINLQTKNIERDIELTYFVCPHCQHEFNSFYTNAKIRTRQEKINELWAKARTAARTASNNYRVKQIIRRIDELVQKNKDEMNQLRERYEASN